MKKTSVIAISAFLISTSAVSAPSWNQWNSDVTADSTNHADAPKTNTNLNIIKSNVSNLSNTLDSSVEKQNDINSKQKAKNDNQDILNNQQVEVNSTQKTWNSNQEGLNDQQRNVNTKQAATNAKVGANLNTLNRDVNWLNGRVDRLDHTMKRGFASQAALSGLFQPYSVGKFNLSMSLGGYESTNALALGSGYRLTEQVAAKVGVATNTEDFKGTSYNAAVNFEW
ncbi:YadA C-terminal domain-containing protein [Rouxiella sp. Mn2063]|uniref:YadA C-terminal domain-containing protein n=1 Tax=Rouxiella sp. Mn2063 TaxID=3395262 RepID=UPI003BECD7C1